MKIVIDACSLILLAKATVLEQVCETYEVFTTNQVYEEIVKGKEKKFLDAFIVERLKEERKLGFVRADKNFIERIAADFNMGAGEASIVAAGIEKKELVVTTDNRQGRKATIVNGLSLVGSIEIIVSLYKRKKITYEKAGSAFKTLKEDGWFDSYLIEKALEDLK